MFSKNKAAMLSPIGGLKAPGGDTKGKTLADDKKKKPTFFGKAFGKK